MSDMPDRIFAWTYANETGAAWDVDDEEAPQKSVAYIRADLHAAAIARAERAEAALAVAEEALQRAASYFGGCSTDRPFAAWNNVRDALAKIAALKGGDA